MCEYVCLRVFVSVILKGWRDIESARGKERKWESVKERKEKKKERESEAEIHRRSRCSRLMSRAKSDIKKDGRISTI